MRRHWLPVAVITYLVLAISWWSVLLFRKNEAFFLAEANLLELQEQSPEEYATSLLDLEEKHQRQKAMIIGESLFLTLSVLAGIILITRAYRKEFQIAKQQQNFLLSITHELRSPIAAIRLGLETLQRRDLPDDKKGIVLRGALAEDERLELLIDKLLLAARIEGDPGLMFSRIAVNKWMETHIDRFRMKWPDHEIRWTPDTDDGYLFVDDSALLSIVTNLVENAVKYSPTSSTIDLAAESRDGGVTMQVMDHGAGIPENEKRSIFEKFYRIGSETTRQSKGTGLGLYISRRLVEEMGGRIQVLDRPGGGSIFQFWLPGANKNFH